MVSELVGRAVRDRSGRHGRVNDLAIDLSAGDYPPVTGLLVECSRACAIVPWSSVVAIDGTFRVDDLEFGPCADAEDPATVLLKRDVMDALVLDLAGERAVRVNDIWVRDEGGRLIVRGFDESPWAVLRRLGRGWLGTGREGSLLDAKDVVYLRGHPRQASEGHDDHRQILRLRPAQIARLADALPYLHAAELICLLPDAIAANVFEMLLPARQIQVLGELDESKTTAILAEMSSDRVADVLGRVELDEAQRLLERLPRERVELVAELLRYPADTAGGIMTNDVMVVPGGLTVREAFGAIRPQLARPDVLDLVYVVADEQSRCLQGVITLRNLILARPEQLVDEVMNRNLVTAEPHEPAQRVAYRLSDNQLSAVPVIEPSGRLLGAVTIDNAVAQIAPEAVRQDLPRVFA